MTPLLALSLVLATVAAASGAGMYLAWPRRMTAEEWVMHRREASKGDRAAGARRMSGLLGRQPRWSLLQPMLGRTGSDLRMLDLQGFNSIEGPEELLSSTVRLAAAGGGAGLVVGLAMWLLSGRQGPFGVVVLMTLALGILPPAIRWEHIRRQAAQARDAIRRRLPRLLTGARVVLEGSGVTPQQALSVAVAVYYDPATGVLREALLDQQVRRVELPDALERAGEAYGVDPLRRLADAYRLATRQGTKVADLLSEFALDLRQEEHAAYRERMTRAPVLMAPLVMVFFVVPLLAMVFFLVLTPLMGALSRL